MKKLVFACLACLLAVSCNRFKSVETPIAGTKNLVTYTAENTSLVGIKAAGAETTLTAPLYVKAEAKYGYLIAQLGRQKADDPVKWALLDTEGQSVTGQTYDRVSYAPAYFMLENAAGKYYLKNGEKSAFGPYQDFYLHGERVFFAKDGKWGIGPLSAEWEKIIVLEQADGKDFRYVVKVPGKKQWKIHDSSGKFLKNTTAAKVAQMEKNAKAKKYADKMGQRKHLRSHCCQRESVLTLLSLSEKGAGLHDPLLFFGRRLRQKFLPAHSRRKQIFRRSHNADLYSCRPAIPYPFLFYIFYQTISLCYSQYLHSA